MTSTAGKNHKEEIHQLLKKITSLWTGGHPEKLKEYFHEKMMIVSPDFQVMGDGREACIKSYEDFMSQAILHDYRESDPEIYMWGNTAIASYKYEIAWEMDGKSYRESDRDLFVFSNELGKWLAVWRTLIPSSEKK